MTAVHLFLSLSRNVTIFQLKEWLQGREGTHSIQG